MLVRSLFVRRLVPANTEEFNKDPTAYQGEWQTDPEGEIGEAISENLVPAADPSAPGGVRMMPLLGVVWSQTKTPAIRYEDPAFLENVDDEVAGDDDEEEEESEEEGQE